MDDPRADDALQGATRAGSVSPPPRTLLIMPASGRAPIVALLDDATREITLKIYTVTDGTLIAALSRAAARGCRVRAILNRVRTDGRRDNEDSFARLEGDGVAVRWADQLRFSASHEKSLVIDGRVAMLGSFNWGERYFTDTRDYGVVTHVAAEVDAIAACFEADWAGMPFRPSESDALLWAPGIARHQVGGLIDAARHSIHLQHAVLADTTMLLRLTDAVRRGVAVRFLCAGGHGLHEWNRSETFASLRILHHAGGRIRRLKHPKVHGNLLLVDDAVAQLGSLHLQHAAFDTRRDLSIELHDPALVDALATRVRQDWRLAERYHPPDPIKHGDTDPVEPDIWCA